MKQPKQPVSVLVVIYTSALDVLLLERAAHPGFWQSVTGSKEGQETLSATAAREVAEETGIVCAHEAANGARLVDWGLENVYDIYPQWLHRYAPGVTRNTERLFGLQVAQRCPVQLNPREHTAHQWLPHHQAAELCFSPSNAEAILQIPRMALKASSILLEGFT